MTKLYDVPTTRLALVWIPFYFGLYPRHYGRTMLNHLLALVWILWFGLDTLDTPRFWIHLVCLALVLDTLVWILWILWFGYTQDNLVWIPFCFDLVVRCAHHTMAVPFTLVFIPSRAILMSVLRE